MQHEAPGYKVQNDVIFYVGPIPPEVARVRPQVEKSHRGRVPALRCAASESRGDAAARMARHCLCRAAADGGGRAAESDGGGCAAKSDGGGRAAKSDGGGCSADGRWWLLRLFPSLLGFLGR